MAWTCRRSACSDLWMRYACTAFYSHPSAWNEIGFGGPAYPRGYKNIGLGRREPWEVAEVDADDPVPWARARRSGPPPSRSVNDVRRGTVVSRALAACVPATRRRGCLPNDGTRTNHALRARHAPLRRRRRGRHRHRRLRRGRQRPRAATRAARLDGRGVRRRTVLGPGPRLGERRARLAPSLLDRTARHRRRRSGRARCEQLGSRASAGRWCTSPATRRAFIRRTSAPRRSTASATTGRSTTRTCGRTTSRSSTSFRSRARRGRGAIRTATRTHRIPSAATVSCSNAAACGRHRRAGRAGRDHERPHGQPAALHLPRVLPPGLQGQRQGVTAHHARPRRARARRRDPAALHGEPGARRPASVAPPASPTSGTASSAANAPESSRSPATRSRRPDCC